MDERNKNTSTRKRQMQVADKSASSPIIEGILVVSKMRQPVIPSWKHECLGMIKILYEIIAREEGVYCSDLL